VVLLLGLAAVAALGLLAEQRRVWAVAAEEQARAKEQLADHQRALAEQAEEQTYQAFEQRTGEASLKFL
jgi:hypothetical protein